MIVFFSEAGGVFKPAKAYLFSQKKILAEIFLPHDQVSSLWLFASQNLWIQCILLTSAPYSPLISLVFKAPVQGVGREMARGTGEFTIYMYLYEIFVAGAHISNSYMNKVGNIPYPTIRQSFCPFSVKNDRKRTKEKFLFSLGHLLTFSLSPPKRIPDRRLNIPIPFDQPSITWWKSGLSKCAQYINITPWIMKWIRLE